MAQRRILFFGEGASLAHVTRPRRVIGFLAGEGYDLHFAYPHRYRPLFHDLRATEHDVGSVLPETVQRRLYRLSPMYSERQLERFLAEDLSVIDRVRPDLVVFDLRPTAPVAAALRGIPAVSIINAYHSPFAHGVAPVSDCLPVRYLGIGVCGAIWRLFPKTLSDLVLSPVARLRARHGLARTACDFYGVFSDEMALYPDADHFAPTPGAPPVHRRIGPIVWRPEPDRQANADIPARFGKDRPMVYVSLGSSGDPGLLPSVVEGAAATGADVLVATGPRAVEGTLPQSRNVTVRAYVDGEAACRRAALVVSNGGNPQLVQALAAGRPVLGLPSNIDQSLNMLHADRTGACLTLHPARVTPRRIARRVDRLIHDPAPRAAAEREAGLIAAIDVGERVRCAFATYAA